MVLFVKVIIQILWKSISLHLWWRHQMETFSAFQALCAGNSPVTGEFPAQKPVTRSFMFSLICVWMNDWVNNYEAGDFRRHGGHYGVTVMFVSNDRIIHWRVKYILTRFGLWIYKVFVKLLLGLDLLKTRPPSTTFAPSANYMNTRWHYIMCVGSLTPINSWHCIYVFGLRVWLSCYGNIMISHDNEDVYLKASNWIKPTMC